MVLWKYMKQRVRKAVVLVNTFGAVGYAFLLLSGALFGGALVWLFMSSSSVSGSVAVYDADATVPGGVAASDTMAFFALATSLFLLSLAVTVLFLYIFGKWGSRSVRHLMKWLRISSTHRNLFLTKGSLAIVPLLGFIWLNIFYAMPDIAIPTLHIASIAASLLAITCFLLQFFIARSLTVSPRDSW